MRRKENYPCRTQQPAASSPTDDRNDSYRSIVSDLVSLIEHVQASMKLIEAAIARESSLGDQEACRQCHRAG